MDGFPSGQRGQTVICCKLLRWFESTSIHYPQAHRNALYRLRMVCRHGGIGRRKGLKIPREQSRTGSSPVAGIRQLRLWKLCFQSFFCAGKLPISHWRAAFHVLFHIRRIFLVIVGKVSISGVLGNVIFVTEKGANTAHRQYTFPSVHDGDFVLRH